MITVFDAIHDQAQPARVLRNIYRALRPGGILLMVDIKASSQLEDNVGVPLATYLYTVSTMHCMSVSLGLDGAGLGTCWGRQLATSMLADAGFGDVTVTRDRVRPDQLLLHRRASKTDDRHRRPPRGGDLLGVEDQLGCCTWQLWTLSTDWPVPTRSPPRWSGPPACWRSTATLGTASRWRR